MISVTYTCPMCGVVWTEDEDPNDEWFKLGTKQTLCARCGQEAIERIKRDREWQEEMHEILSRRTSGN